MRLVTATVIFVLGGTALLVAGPYDDSNEAFVAAAAVAVPFLSGLVAARFAVAWLALLAVAPGIAIVDSSSGEITKASLYSSLATAVVAIAGLLALGAWVGTLLARRSESRTA